MLLPTDSDRNPFSHRPWATTTLGLVWVLLFAVMQVTNQTGLQGGLRRLEAAVEYHRQHPYLALDPRLVEILGKDLGVGTGAAGQPHRHREGSLGTQFSTLEQTELDGITSGGFDALGTLPHSRYAVVPAHFRVHTLLTYTFAHARWIPILANLVLLYLLGVYLEGRWRRAPLAALWLLSGIAAGLCFTVRFPDYPVPLLGAGGAIAGLAGAFAVEYWNRSVRFDYWCGPGLQDNVGLPGLVILLPWALRELLNLYSPDVLIPESGDAMVVYWAHGSAFACGAAMTLLFKVTGLYDRFVALPEESTVQPVRPSGARRPRARGAAAQPEPRPAGDHWESLYHGARNDPGNADLVQELWTLAMQTGRQREAAPDLLRHIQALTRGPHGKRAHLLWQEFRRHLPDGPIPVALEVNLGKCLLEQGLEEEARQVLSRAAEAASATDAPGTLLRLARLLQPPQCANIAQLALQHPDLPETKRREAEELLPDRSPPQPQVRPGRRAAGREFAAATTSPPAPAPLTTLRAVPLGVKNDRLGVELAGGGRRSIPLRQIRAIAAAAVYDGGVEPDYVLDLLLDHPASSDATVQTVRLHSGDFDPRSLIPAETEIEDAFLSFAGMLLTAGSAAWLLGSSPVELRTYDTPEHHQTELLTAVRMNAAG